MSTRQLRYETVGDGSDEGNSSHWIVLFCQRYWLAGVGGRSSTRRALSGQDSPEKRRENGGNVNPISEHQLRGSRLGRAMNLVDRLRTSADERVLSGRRAVVIA